jgi:hypothetical protein
MGEVVDEKTGQKPSCIFCEKKDGCPHLVAVIDRTFSECYGGALYEILGDLKDMLSDIVSGMIKGPEYLDKDAVNHELGAILQEAVGNYDPAYPDYISIDNRMLFDWLIEALISAGAEESPGYIVEQEGPGQSSALTLLYAKHPDRVIHQVEKTLDDLRAKFKAHGIADIDDDEVSSADFTHQAEPTTCSAVSAKIFSVLKPSKDSRRPVLIVVTKWPSGTMAFKFGGAMKASLGATEEELTLVQMGPERIFRVETKVREADFRKAMASYNVASGGTILFIEIPTN